MAVRVLIADDIPQVREDLRTLLTLAGDIEVVGEAANGVEAIHLAEALRPDAVLMDIEMPVLDGFGATRQIKTRCPSCRVIALTIHAGEDTRRRSHSAGVDVFLAKGVPFEDLLQAINGTPPGYR